MRKTSKIITAAVLSTALICTLSVTGNAATINIKESSISLDSINKDWKEVSDENTFHTFSNGTDKVTVLKYDDYDDLPAPAKVDDKYEAVYQTFFSAGNEIYVVTGCAVRAKDISDVREIIDSITYPEMASSEKGNTVSMTSSTNTSKTADSSTNRDENTNKNDDQQISEQGWDSIILYDTDMNGVYVTRGNDGNWYDENGVSYGNLDIADDEAPIYNSNGEAYYWNGSFAQAAANASSGTDNDSEENSSYSEDTDSSANVNDPYDLYSWDAGTNSFIPFQQADGDGAPIGRGNGWYYYDSDSNSYAPW